MSFYPFLYFVINLTLACLTLSLFFLFYFFRGGSIYRAASSLMLAYWFWLIIEFLERTARSTDIQVFFSMLQYTVPPFFSILWISYCYNINRNKSFFRVKFRSLLFIYPLTVILLVLTSGRHHLLWTNLRFVQGHYGVIHDKTVLSAVIFYTLIASVVIGTVLLVRRPGDDFLYNRRRIGYTVGVAVFAVITALYEWFSINIESLELLPASFTILGLASLLLVKDKVQIQIMLHKYDVLATLKEPLFIIRMDGLMLFANDAGIRMTGAGDIEFPGRDIKELIPSLGELSEGVIFHEGRFYTVNTNPVRINKEDLLTIAFTEVTALKDSEINLKHLSYELEKQVQNRTEKLNQSKEQLEKLVEEKNILLQEVHHRVNNNLQLIISLLNLQGSRTENEELKDYLKEAVSRVQTIAMVHLMLYRSEDFSRINLRTYLEDLVRSILKENGEHLKMDFADLICSTTTCIQIGMIMNEIILNALKHAYSIDEKEKHFYCVSRIEKQKECADRLHIEFRDFGKGLEKEQESSSLGFKIINTLVTQRNGELKVYNDAGCVYSLWVEL